MKRITSTQGTFLKKRPVNSDQLTESEKVAVPVGKSYQVQVLTTNAGHTQVRISHGAGDFWIFNKHWKGLKSNLVTLQQVEHIFENLVAKSLLDDINLTLEQFEINTPSRIRHFLSQCSHESGGGKWLLELADGSAYEGRTDLGNTKSGDGKLFKGAGLIQVTGRFNYEQFSKSINPRDNKILDLGAVYVSKTYPCRISGFWWKSNGLNELCDRNPTVTAVTLRVNGGRNGLMEREMAYARACEVIK